MAVVSCGSRIFLADIVIYNYDLHKRACLETQILLRRHTAFYGISHISCNVQCRVIISVKIKPSIRSRINRFQNYNITGSSQNIKFHTENRNVPPVLSPKFRITKPFG